MKHNKYSQRNAQQKQPSETSTSRTCPLELRLETAFRIVESLDYAESSLEYQLRMGELRQVLQPPG